MENGYDGGGVVQRTTEYTFNPRGSSSGIGEFPAVDGTLNMAEKVIFLEPGQEKAQNIVKAMSHQNAGDVVQLLSLEGPLKMSDISERLDISLNAAKYHIENLMNAEILEISNTRYSVKGKKIKIYRLKNQVFIVAPKMTSIAEVRTALMRYSAALVIFISVFCVAAVQSYVPTYIVSHPGSIGSQILAIFPNGDGTIPAALITATAVTLLLLVIYEIYTHWKNLHVSSG
ncbi:MAG: helix-turn-helix domain-containing protein [Methanoregula sp.]|jgi:DNA-binding transcriptional ArsR family regulator